MCKMAKNKQFTIRKKIAKHDDAKRASGDSCITLDKSKPCYECDGSRSYAEKINCRAYRVGR